MHTPNQQQLPQHRLAPGPSSLPGYGRGQPMTPAVRGPYTPSPAPGYTPSGPMWLPPNPGTYRGVGRPRKYDIRR